MGKPKMYGMANPKPPKSWMPRWREKEKSPRPERVAREDRGRDITNILPQKMGGVNGDP